MTNAQIITQARFDLMEQGIIGTTGRELVMKLEDGTEKIVKEPEEIHTFQAWKELGYKVKKGEHAIARFTIWKHTSKENEDGKKEEHMFMKNACFFKASQVEAMA